MVFGLFRRRTEGSAPQKKKGAGGKVKAGRTAGSKGVRAPRETAPEPVKVGEVTHYFGKVKAGVVKVARGPIEVGDKLCFKGHTTDFKQKVASMQIEGEPIKRARKGQSIGIKVRSRVRVGDRVYLVK